MESPVDEIIEYCENGGDIWQLLGALLEMQCVTSKDVRFAVKCLELYQ